MAKANHSPLTMWRGKAGGQVYRVSNGRQIVSEYQPKVANPRTTPQMMQRAKFSLAGKLSGITPDTAIFGMNATRGQRRPDFVRNILVNATAMVDPTALQGEEIRYIGRIGASYIVFSKGEDYLSPDQLTTVTVERPTGEDFARVDLSQLTGLEEFQLFDFMVIDLYGASTNDYVSVNAVKLSEGGSNAIDFSGFGVHRLYLVPINLDNVQNGSPISDDLADDETDDGVMLGLSMSALAASANYGRSYYLGTVTVAEN